MTSATDAGCRHVRPSLAPSPTGIVISVVRQPLLYIGGRAVRTDQRSGSGWQGVSFQEKDGKG